MKAAARSLQVERAEMVKAATAAAMEAAMEAVKVT